MEIGLLLVGLCIGVVVGWLVRQATSRADRTGLQQELESLSLHHQQDLAATLARHDRELSAVRHEAEIAAARHETAIVAAREEEREQRALVEADLASAQASVEELRQLVAEHRRAQQERERGESGQTQVLKTLTPVVEHLRT